MNNYRYKSGKEKVNEVSLKACGKFNTPDFDDIVSDVHACNCEKHDFPRSKAYMETLYVADLLSSHDEEIINRLKNQVSENSIVELANMSSEDLENEIKDVVEEELSDLGELEGILCKCHISGCDCHEISPKGKILHHFKREEELPEHLADCRKLFQEYPKCVYIEVYQEKLVIVNSDSTTIIKNK